MNIEVEGDLGEKRDILSNSITAQFMENRWHPIVLQFLSNPFRAGS